MINFQNTVLSTLSYNKERVCPALNAGQRKGIGSDGQQFLRVYEAFPQDASSVPSWFLHLLDM